MPGSEGCGETFTALNSVVEVCALNCERVRFPVDKRKRNRPALAAAVCDPPWRMFSSNRPDQALRGGRERTERRRHLYGFS